jgi:hypothetical protein
MDYCLLYSGRIKPNEMIKLVGSAVLYEMVRQTEANDF